MPTNDGDIRGNATDRLPAQPDVREQAASERFNKPPKHRLDSGKIVETATNLANDIGARLPGSTLAALADELKTTAVTADDRVRRAQEPMISIRLISVAAVVAVLLALWYLARHIHAKWEFATINEVFDGVHTGFELLVILAGAIWFCVTLETRLKRKAALAFIEDLREFIHVIDVTQLYYTPDLYGSRVGDARTTRALDETYLLYCTQMLAVISNLAPLCSRGAPGDSVLRAASDVEMLAIAVSTKHMSKAEFVRSISLSAK
jgi:hypothetical protein